MIDLLEFGAFVNGSYQGQGGITAYGEWTMSLLGDGPRLCLTAGGAVSFFRNRDLAAVAPSRTFKWGGLYVGPKLYIPLGDRLLELFAGAYPNAEVIYNLHSIRLHDWSGWVLRASVLVF